MKTVAEALAVVLARATLLETERVSLGNARSRVLREDARADRDLPPFDCSAMDGYALRSDEQHEWLELVGEIQAGNRDEIVLRPGECARIFTGAPIPAGANCVLMQEDAEVSGNRLKNPPCGAPTHIRRRGENCALGDLLVPAGRRLRSVDLAVLASCGITQPLVSRRPQVVHFATGNELVDPAQTPVDGQIRDCNSILIASLLAEWGGDLVHQSRLPDELENGVASILAQEGFDLLLLSGGASVGDYDYARPLLEKAGFSVAFHGINLRPGKPLLFATRGRQLAFGLPGNPVSHAVLLRLFLAPLLATMEGADASHSFLQGLVDGSAFQKGNPRESFWPCHADCEEGSYRLRPVPIKSSGDITGITNANALLRIPAGQGLQQDDPAQFLWL
ncbi:MAG: molybdopterin molybdotransferase MoeA [Verrucomicrobia bacterium]|nr:molybdopterin molybdotransferase MoeA [Verrucomicrobiota bacterium]